MSFAALIGGEKYSSQYLASQEQARGTELRMTPVTGTSEAKSQGRSAPIPNIVHDNVHGEVGAFDQHVILGVLLS